MANEVSYQVTLNIDKASARMQGLYDKNAKLFASVKVGFDVVAARTQIAELVRSFRNGFRKTLITFDTSTGFRQLDVLKAAAQAKFSGIALSVETKKAFDSVNSVSAAAKKGLGDVTMGLNTKNAQQRVDFFVKSAQNKINNIRMPGGANFLPTTKKGGGGNLPPLPVFYNGGGGGGGNSGGKNNFSSGNSGSGKGMLTPLGKMDASSFEKSIEAASTRVLAFGAITGVIYSVGRAFKTLVSDAISVEQSMASLQSILEVSKTSMQGISDEAFKLANRTGTSFTIAIDAMTEFARQGLSSSKVIEATAAALTLARISGVGAAEAVRSLTGVSNTFSHEALNYAKAVDTLISLDNSFATSAAGLSSGIQRVGATASEAGVSFKELAALMTAVQQMNARGETVNANGLKTIYTRLQREKSRSLLNDLGIETEVLGEFRNMNEVLEELAQKYNTLTDAQKAYTAETLAGGHQINVFQSVMRSMQGDFSMYKRAMDVAGEATGDATERLKILNDTTATLVTRVRNNFAKFGAEFGKISVKPFIDNMLSMGNRILKIFDSDIGKKLGESLSHGLSSVVLGPGLFIGLAATFRVIQQIWKEFFLLIKGAINFNKSTKDNSLLQSQVNSAIAQGNGLLEQRLILQNQINGVTVPKGMPIPATGPGTAGQSPTPTAVQPPPVVASPSNRWQQVSPAVVSGASAGAASVVGPMIVRGQGMPAPGISTTGNAMHANFPNTPLVYSAGGYSTQRNFKASTQSSSSSLVTNKGSARTGSTGPQSFTVNASGGGVSPLTSGSTAPILIGPQNPYAANTSASSNAAGTTVANAPATKQLNLFTKAAQKATEGLKSAGAAGAGLAISFAGGVIGESVGGKWGGAITSGASWGGTGLMLSGGNPFVGAGAALAGGIYGYAKGKDDDPNKKYIQQQGDALQEEKNAITEAISARSSYVEALREGKLGLMDMNDLYDNVLRSTSKIKNSYVAGLLSERGVANEDKNALLIQESMKEHGFMTTLNQLRGAFSSIAKDNKKNFINGSFITNEGQENIDAISHTLKSFILDNRNNLTEKDVAKTIEHLEKTLSMGDFNGVNTNQADSIVKALKAGGVEKDSLNILVQDLDNALANLGKKGGDAILESVVNVLKMVNDIKVEDTQKLAKQKAEKDTEEDRKNEASVLSDVFKQFANKDVPLKNLIKSRIREDSEKERNAMLEIVKPFIGDMQAAKIARNNNIISLEGKRDTETENLTSEMVGSLFKAIQAGPGLTAPNARSLQHLAIEFANGNKSAVEVAQKVKDLGIEFEKSKELLDEILNENSEFNGKLDRINAIFYSEVDIQKRMLEIQSKSLKIAEGEKVMSIDSILSGGADEQQKNVILLGSQISGITKEIDKLNKSGGPKTDKGKQQLRNLEVQLAKLEMERRNTMGEILGVSSGKEELQLKKDNLKNEETIREKQIKDFAIQEITASAERVREKMKNTGSGEVRGFTQENVNKLVKKINKEGISGTNRGQIEESIKQMSKFATNEKVTKELDRLKDIISLFASKADQISNSVDDKLSLLGEAQLALNTLNPAEVKNQEAKDEAKKEKDEKVKEAETTKGNIEKLGQITDGLIKQVQNLNLKVDKTLRQEIDFEVDINTVDLGLSAALKEAVVQTVENKIKEVYSQEKGRPQPVFLPKTAN